jgi:hypothetical protein
VTHPFNVGVLAASVHWWSGWKAIWNFTALDLIPASTNARNGALLARRPDHHKNFTIIFSRVMRRLVDQQRCVLDRVQEAATKGPSEDGCSARALSNRCHRSAQSGRFAKGEGGLSVARPRPAGQSRRLLLNISRSMTSTTTSSRLASKPTSRGSACAQQASNRSSLRCASARGA